MEKTRKINKTGLLWVMGGLILIGFMFGIKGFEASLFTLLIIAAVFSR